MRILKPSGKGACILPHGVLFRGNAEGVIRKNLIQRGYIKAIIGLPANLFYGTGIPACVLLIDKEGGADRKGIFMIDASKGFMKDGNKNRLRAQDIHKIVDTFSHRADLPGYSRMVPVAEISDAKNDFNLNLPRYIDSTEPEDLQDINGHLRGGIPERDIDAVDRYWKIIPGVRSALFERSPYPGYSQLRVAASDIKSGIFSHPEFTTLNQSATKLLKKWKKANRPVLKTLTRSASEALVSPSPLSASEALPETSDSSRSACASKTSSASIFAADSESAGASLALRVSMKPKALIEKIAEDLLATFEKAPLLDPYDIYQHLMDYWAETMQDDCYLIAGDGWVKAAQLRLLEDAKNDKDKLTKASVAERLKQLRIENGELKTKASPNSPSSIVHCPFSIVNSPLSILHWRTPTTNGKCCGNT